MGHSFYVNERNFLMCVNNGGCVDGREKEGVSFSDFFFNLRNQISYNFVCILY